MVLTPADALRSGDVIFQHPDAGAVQLLRLRFTHRLSFGCAAVPRGGTFAWSRTPPGFDSPRLFRHKERGAQSAGTLSRAKLGTRALPNHRRRRLILPVTDAPCYGREQATEQRTVADHQQSGDAVVPLLPVGQQSSADGGLPDGALIHIERAPTVL